MSLRRSVIQRQDAVFLVCGVCVGLLFPPALRAQGTGGPRADETDIGALNAVPMSLSRLSGPIEIDGMPSEMAWESVPALPLTMYFPEFRGSPAERTEIRVAYDDEYLYAAGWFYDSDPSGIRVNSLYRDRWNGDDAFAIYIDPFNDNQNAKWFGTTPGGIRFDILVSDDGATLNNAWDTFWDAETTVTDQGWFAEVRIPFSSLGFQTDEGNRAVMGLTVTRLVSRTGERVTFPAIDPRFEFRQPSVARDIVLEGVRSPEPAYLTPYVLTGVSRTPVLDEGMTAYGTDRDFSREVGGDFRYALSSELTLDLTANTDFAQVEADDQQVNLDRFSLFFPEKRRFFQERSGLFEFTMGGGARLFHSRRIGLTPERTPVPVLGGARLVGRMGEWDVGVLNMQTRKQGGLSGENFGVARLKRQVLNPFSYVGLMATTRTGGGRENGALGVDGSLRMAGDHYLTLKWAGSVDDGDPDGTGLLDRSQINAKWQRRVQEGLAYTLEYARSGAGFEPGTGFLARRDYTVANVLVDWINFTEGSTTFRRVWPGALAFSTLRNDDGKVESGQYAAWVQWETNAGTVGWLEPKYFIEDVAAPFTIGDEVEIPAGRHTFADLQFALYMASGRKLRTNLDARAGTFFDGTRRQIILGPTWNVNPHLELGGEYQWSRLRFDDRDQGTDIHVARLKVRTAVNARASGNAFVQYNSTADRLEFNLRLRYNFAEGTDLWLVYNEGLDTERELDPGLGIRPPLSRSRSLILKYSYTFGG